MDVFALILTITVVSAAMAALLWKRGRRRAARPVSISEVHQQHVYLFQGGHLSESAIESARIAFQRSLDSGDLGRVDSSLERGTRFAAQVRALTEIGSEAAGAILERQLRRRVSNDPLEQSWYWLDVACGLRTMARSESLPALIHCILERELPLGHFLAAEATCFPGFLRLLESPGLPLGASAVRVLTKSLAGLRVGVQPHFVGVGRLGEAVETLWDSRPEPADPGAVRVFVEALKLLRRAEHAERLFDGREADRDAFCRQVDRIRDLADVLSDYLDEARIELLVELQTAGDGEHSDILQALIDLKADTAEALIPLLQLNRIAPRELVFESLAHSRDPRVGPFVCQEIGRPLTVHNRQTGSMIQAALRVLRRHPSREAESILLRASKEKDTATRVAALQSLGWWDPLRHDDVLSCLKQARYHGNSMVLHAAQAALARLGERQALRWFRHQLAGECSDMIHQTIRQVADEGLLLLWPDVDALADAENPDIAFHACEALEQLREDLPISAPAR